MPLRRAVRWFSEICGVSIGLGLVWCIARITILEERVDGLQKVIKNPVVQQNNQQVIIEDPRTQLIKELAIQNGWKPDVNRKLQPSATNAESSPGTESNDMPATRGRTAVTGK